MSADAKSLGTALAEATHPVSSMELAVQVSGLSAPLVQTLRRTLCAKFTDEQSLLFLAICKQKGVDPFTQAYGFPAEGGGLAFGLRIDGMRALAMRTGEYLSRTVEDLTDPKDASKVIGARATIQRKGMTSTVVEDAYFSEYDRPNGGQGWKQFPITMIRKVAESKALRAAFPDALAGVYEPSEMQE
jgi:phage recombination protein Bet